MSWRMPRGPCACRRAGCSKHGPGGVRVNSAQVAGEPFWSTVEIAECPELLEHTCEMMKAAP